jgi:L-2-hydroxyglutarate oxidase
MNRQYNVEDSYDIAVIGSGAIGCAVARSLSQKYQGKVAVIEKESIPAYHTSGRNSGVVHSGFNQKPGTLKATFCVEGNRRTREFCDRHSIPLMKVGTVVVSQNEQEYRILKKLESQGKQNGVEGIRIIDQKELSEREPYATGMAALYSPTGCIVGSREYVAAIAEESRQNGVNFFYEHRVEGVKKNGSYYRIITNRGELKSKAIINCAGLYADRVAEMLGLVSEYRIIPFRGEYYELKPAKSHMVNSMVYPAPNLELPFLGVHFTRTVYGKVLVGPNAVFASAREGYSRTSVSLRDMVDAFSFSGFRKLFSRKFLGIALGEFYRSINAGAFAEEARKLMPSLKKSDLAKGQRGIRAQLVDKHGNLVEDFVIKVHENSVNVLNVVSPGLTSSLPFGDHVVDIVLRNVV